MSKKLSFLDFMKKFSTINNNFLDDFINFYDEKTLSTDIVINIDKVIKWLDIKKHSLKKTLIETYKRNIDYKIERVENGIGRKEVILITPDCFKRLCQLTKSEQGEEVRTYFIELEKMINKYRLYIIDGLENRVKKLKDNQKPKNYPKGGVIYVFNVADKTNNNLFKIGKTKDLRRRLSQHQSSLADDIDVLFVFECENMDRVEMCIKAAAKGHQYRKRKEVYEININLLKSIVADCDTLINKYQKPNITKDQFGGKIFLFIDK